MRFGELKEPGAMIEQVKGFSYSVYALLGRNSLLPMVHGKDVVEESSEGGDGHKDQTKKSWWRVALASPKIRDPMPARYAGIYTLFLWTCPHSSR